MSLHLTLIYAPPGVFNDSPPARLQALIGTDAGPLLIAKTHLIQIWLQTCNKFTHRK